MLRQRSRPYLFSNSLAPSIVGASIEVFKMLDETTELRDTLEKNTAYFKEGLRHAGLPFKDGESAIVPVMLGDAKLSQVMAMLCLRKAFTSSAFSIRWCPRAKPESRVQLGAAHSREHLDRALAAFRKSRARPRRDFLIQNSTSRNLDMVQTSKQRIIVVGREFGRCPCCVEVRRTVRRAMVETVAPSASRVAARCSIPFRSDRSSRFGTPLSTWRKCATVQAIEAASGLAGQLLYDVPVAKVFANSEYRDTWDARWDENHGVCQWATVGEDLAGARLAHVEVLRGSGVSMPPGWVDVPELLDALERHFDAIGALHDRSWA